MIRSYALHLGHVDRVKDRFRQPTLCIPIKKSIRHCLRSHEAMGMLYADHASSRMNEERDLVVIDHEAIDQQVKRIVAGLPAI